jgi:potassium-transporting ATPase ATP-binding subunit
MENKKTHFFASNILFSSMKEAVKSMTFSSQRKNPVMFITFLGAILCGAYVIREFIRGDILWFDLEITFWLFFTVLCANFAQSLAESRGKAQALALRQIQVANWATLLKGGKESKVHVSELKKGDIIRASAGEFIAADGDVIEGIATVDESAITGESAPVIRESGGDRSAVTQGTRVVSDHLVIRVTSEKGTSFLDRMISLIEGAKRQKTPNEIALHIVLSSLSLLFLLTTISLKFFYDYSAGQGAHLQSDIVTVPVLIALLVCLIPTTISSLLSAVGIAGMDRLILRNVVAKSGRSVEAAGDIDVLLLDKTGTITLGNRRATEFLPIETMEEKEFARIAQLASLPDETPEGRSIVVLAKKLYGLKAETIPGHTIKFTPFSAKTRMSGVDILDKEGKVVRSIRKGAQDAIQEYVEHLGGLYPQEVASVALEIAKSGGTPLVVADNNRVCGVIHLKDIVKGGLKERFREMRLMGIRTIMITGDNPLTAAAIAAEAGVDDYEAEASPEKKLEVIRREQSGGRLVAMIGDGTNDAPALAQADVGVVMNTGTQASREAGNMVDLDSNPTKLLDIVEIGKQLLMTRGALTTFSIANDVAKYFAIIPALFGSLYVAKGMESSPLSVLNIMELSSPHSAILSAVIFNALIIPTLIPLALRGVRYKTKSPMIFLRNNILIYGFGGIFAPFCGIKAIDLLLQLLGGGL